MSQLSQGCTSWHRLWDKELELNDQVLDRKGKKKKIDRDKFWKHFEKIWSKKNEDEKASKPKEVMGSPISSDTSKSN